MSQPVWNTPAGSIGSYPASLPLLFDFSATPVLPAISVTYVLISGSLPIGITLSTHGLLSGIPGIVTGDTISEFTIRVTDNLGNIRDRTFSMIVSGSAIPQFTTPNGSILSTQDSIWVQLPITYSNPEITNPVIIQIREGALPPGLEIDSLGVIRGYAHPPVVTLTNPPVVTNSTQTEQSNNTVIVTSTVGFYIGRPVVFSGTTFGEVVAGQVYYVKQVLSSTTFTISVTQNGPTFIILNGTGSMTVTLPQVSFGNPTIRTYNFTLGLTSPLGNSLANYSITVINQNTPVSQGGPGKPNNSRLPVILNTRPLTYNIHNSDPYYGYYILPPVAPTQFANMGNFKSGEYFAFKIIGNDFDGSDISYSFSNLPNGLIGNAKTGWITGYPTLTSDGVSSYNFGVSVYKKNASQYASPYFNFTFNLQKNVTGNITWITDVI